MCLWLCLSGRGCREKRRNQFQRSGHHRLMAIRGCMSGWSRRRISAPRNLRGRPRDTSIYIIMNGPSRLCRRKVRSSIALAIDTRISDTRGNMTRQGANPLRYMRELARETRGNFAIIELYYLISGHGIVELVAFVILGSRTVTCVGSNETPRFGAR